MLLTQTGFPQIFPDPKWKTFAAHTDYLYVIDIKGIPDFLLSLNYTLNNFATGKIEAMGFGAWTRWHNYSLIYNAKNDLYLFNYLSDEYLPKIDKEIRNSNFEKHFLSFIINANTHSPYNRPKWCNLNLNDIPETQKCFHCIDFAVNKFIRKFIELKMYEHTLLVIYPDHPPFNTNYKELFMLFPGMKKVDSNLKINGEITYYDFAPTILDLIGIKQYQPAFPFGRSIYLNSHYNQKYCDTNNNCIERRSKPDLDDLTVIYKYVHFDHGQNIHSYYNLSNPFTCKINGTNRYYYSYSPCSTNIRGSNRKISKTLY